MVYIALVLVLAFAEQSEPNIRVCDFLALLARNFEFTKITSCVVSGCLRLFGAPDALTHPTRSVTPFRGLWLLVRL